jgi:predicted nucleic acid-binding protein
MRMFCPTILSSWPKSRRLAASAIRHEPDNRFLECALAVSADFLITVNTARGHFDRKDYQGVRVVTPGEFLRLPAVRPLVARLTGR